MKRLLMVAAVVAGVSVTGLSGSAMAGYPTRSYVPSYSVSHSTFGGYGGYGAYNGYGGANRGCWGGYKAPVPHRNVYKPAPYNYGNKCGTNYSGYFGSPWRW